MAYRDTKIITCPNCGASGEVLWVVGMNMAKDRGAGDWTKSYTARSHDDFNIDTTHSRDRWEGTVTCTTCQTIAKKAPA